MLSLSTSVHIEFDVCIAWRYPSISFGVFGYEQTREMGKGKTGLGNGRYPYRSVYIEYGIRGPKFHSYFERGNRGFTD